MAVLSNLVGDVLSALLATGKLYEEVGGAWVGEETLLGLLTIFVHGISDKSEVYRCATYHLLNIIFLELMTKNN